MLLIAGLVFWVFYGARHPGFASISAEECRAAYAKARTAADSGIVDATTSASGARKEPNTLTCGALRRSGELR